MRRGSHPTCEGLLAAGEDDGSHLRVALHGLQRAPQLRHEPLAERIERLRPVQLDQPHVLLCPRLLYQQVLERSPCPPHQHRPVSSPAAGHRADPRTPSATPGHRHCVPFKGDLRASGHREPTGRHRGLGSEELPVPPWPAKTRPRDHPVLGQCAWSRHPVLGPDARTRDPGARCWAAVPVPCCAVPLPVHGAGPRCPVTGSRAQLRNHVQVAGHTPGAGTVLRAGSRCPVPGLVHSPGTPCPALGLYME